MKCIGLIVREVVLLHTWIPNPAYCQHQSSSFLRELRSYMCSQIVMVLSFSLASYPDHTWPETLLMSDLDRLYSQTQPSANMKSIAKQTSAVDK